MNLSDMHLELKEICQKLIYAIFDNLKLELFDDYSDFTNDVYSTEFNFLNKKSLLNFEKELNNILSNLRNDSTNFINEENLYDDLSVRTDLKYLNYIKRLEMNMLIESKRRMKTKRTELKEDFNNINNLENEDDFNNNYDKDDCDEKKIKKIKIENIINHTSEIDLTKINILNDSKLDNININLDNLEEKKILRSSRRSQDKNKINEFYKIFSNSLYVIKPIRSIKNINYREKVKSKKKINYNSEIEENLDNVNINVEGENLNADLDVDLDLVVEEEIKIENDTNFISSDNINII